MRDASRGPAHWVRGAAAPPLAADEVHIWRIALDVPAENLARLRRSLSEDECDRADRFYFEIDRSRYVVAHSALRNLLAQYLGVSAYRDRFSEGPNGKPALAPGASLRFNLSHSKGLALIALATGREVGVDIEAIDERVEIDGVAERFFSPEECRGLRTLPSDHQVAAFFHVWSQKEAYLKARGDGVAFGLDHFDVTPDPARPAGLLADRREPGATGGWTLLAIDPGDGFRGAVAVEGVEPAVRRFRWD